MGWISQVEFEEIKDPTVSRTRELLSCVEQVEIKQCITHNSLLKCSSTHLLVAASTPARHPENPAPMSGLFVTEEEDFIMLNVMIIC